MRLVAEPSSRSLAIGPENGRRAQARTVRALSKNRVKCGEYSLLGLNEQRAQDWQRKWSPNIDHKCLHLDVLSHAAKNTMSFYRSR